MAKTAKEKLLEAQARLKAEQDKIAKLEQQVKEETEKSFAKSRKIMDAIIKDCIDRGIDAKVLEEKMESAQKWIEAMNPDEANAEVAEENDSPSEEVKESFQEFQKNNETDFETTDTSAVDDFGDDEA